MVLALSEVGIENITFDIFINYLIGGFILFLLAWMYFDFVGNKDIKQTNKRTMATWWYAHMCLMFCAVLISIALKAEVNVHYYQTYPLTFAALGCFGAIGYLLCLEAIQKSVKNEIAHQFANFEVKIFGIVFIIFAFLASWQGFPSWIGNLTYLIGIGSQLAIPIYNAYKKFKPEVEQMHENHQV